MEKNMKTKIKNKKKSDKIDDPFKHEDETNEEKQ